MANLNIKIPEQFYVGFKTTHRLDIPLGCMTPYSTDAQGRKRQDTINGYTQTNQNGNTTSLNCVILDNTPMVGFRISRALRRGGWGGNSTVIRIEDPRGFELEINAVNMIMLTDENTIQNGELLCACVWARDGSENVLLPVNSSPYLEAAENTRRLTNKISLRNVNIGDRILTVKGMTGIFMGSMYPILQSQPYTMDDRTISFDNKKRYIIKTIDSNNHITYHGFSTFSVSEVLEVATTPMTIIEAHQQICNDLLNFEANVVDMNSVSYKFKCLGFSVGGASLVSTAYRPIELDKVIAIHKNHSNYDLNFSIFGTCNKVFSLFPSENFVGDGRYATHRYHSGSGYIHSTDYSSFPVKQLSVNQSRISFVNGRNMTMINDVEIIDFTCIIANYVDLKTNESFSILI